MHHHKILTLSLLTTLLVLAGCTQTATNTNTTGTTNDNANVEVVTNTNATVSNENTNDSNVNSDVDSSTVASAEVDTSDPALSEVEGWLTYTNEEYGFSFRYPREWSIVSPGSGEANNSIYLYSNFPNSDGDEKLTNDEIKIDVQFIAAQDQFLDEDSLCHRKYTTLDSTDYKISCNKKQVHSFDFLQIETEIFPSDKLPGDSLSMLYTNLSATPFQVSMNAYFGSLNGLNSSDRIVVEQIFSSMQIE